MSSFKKQHYVPKLYLRNFAAGDPPAYLALYNLGSARFVPKAPYADQCYRDYFYGKDGEAERSFHGIEGPAARAIKAILKDERPPQRFGPDHSALRAFAILQGARTAQAEAETLEAADKTAKVMLRHHFRDQPQMLQHLDKLRLTSSNAVHLSIRTALRSEPMINDLKLKLLINRTSEPFHTSDHPVVRLNSLYAGTTDRSVHGLANVGLQIILPLSPRHAILFYDEEAYEIGDRANPALNLRNLDHVRSINALQRRYAKQNLYFHPSTPEALIREMAEVYMPTRETEQVRISDRVTRSDAQSHRVLLLAQSPASAGILLPKTRFRIAAEPLGAETELPLRHPTWAMAHRALMKAIDAGEADEAEFARFSRLVPRRAGGRGRTRV